MDSEAELEPADIFPVMSREEFLASKSLQFAYDLDRENVVARDRQYAMGLVRNEIVNYAEVMRVQREYHTLYDQESEDRKLALRMARGSGLPIPVQSQSASGTPTQLKEFQETRTIATEWLLSHPDSIATTTTKEDDRIVDGMSLELGSILRFSDLLGNPSTSQDAMKSGKAVPLLECVVCMESFDAHSALTLTCNDTYCTVCLGHLFKTAISDRSMLPVRCCKQKINIAYAEMVLRPSDLKSFLAVWEEYICEDKMYCYSRACGRFINTSRIHCSSSNMFSCPHCRCALCKSCKTGWHQGLACDEFQRLPEDERSPEDAAVLALAKVNKWQRCYQCHAFASLITGCNHVVCTMCSAHFCYKCGSRWDQQRYRCTSGCEVWDERLLLAQAEREVEEQAPVGLNAAELAQHVQDVVEAIQQRHECAHVWLPRTVHRPQQYTCTQCHWHPDRFIMECTRCHDMRCARCSRQLWW